MVNDECQEVERLYKSLIQSWSIHSSSKWTQETPAKGQCGVTALVVHDLLGGEIRKTELPEGWHYYNIISGKRYDFTASQFDTCITYMDIRSNRDEAMLDTNEQQYHFLKKRVQRILTMD
ncbi:hypothetical protein LCM10_03315 [Rossellomorea aquimaris]|uniref:YunG family protein n=1 Tax=Rossellomorea aquimaris TaxID=189382 RepID=UPI001CD38BDD|nr:hypothetical protein [Rossellomorea aquimaris]MCA1054005.1 hypothetical protein [Rossellomorea aquimaris]